MTRKQWTLAGAVLAVMVGFFVYRTVRADPRLEEIRQKRDEIMTKAKDTSDPEEQRQLWKDLRESRKDLTPEQKKALGADAHKRRDQEEQRYFSLDDEEKAKWLDSQIDRAEEMRRRWEERKEKGEGGGSPNRSEDGAGGRGPGGKDAWSKMTNEEKENRRKAFLDSTTPEQRARRDQIRKDLNARRELRGLPTFGGGGFGR